MSTDTTPTMPTTGLRITRVLTALVVASSTQTVAKSFVSRHVDEPENRRQELRNRIAVYGLATAASVAAVNAVDGRLMNAVNVLRSIQADLAKAKDESDDVTPE